MSDVKHAYSKLSIMSIVDIFEENYHLYKICKGACPLIVIVLDMLLINCFNWLLINVFML